jgi:tryptophanyl-tRNA synthetase
LYKQDVLPEPAAKLTAASRLVGLDGRKMSKSYNNAINISDDEATIRSKVQTMITDPQRIKLSDPGHPDVCTVYSYYGIFAPERIAELTQACQKAGIGCTECKKKMASILDEKLRPFREKREKLISDKQKIRDILEHGAGRARIVAQKTLHDVRTAMKI